MANLSESGTIVRRPCARRKVVAARKSGAAASRCSRLLTGYCLVAMVLTVSCNRAERRGQTADGRGELPTLLRAHESGLRKIALEQPLPNYPPESIQRGSTGVAVEQILVAPDGSVANAVNLQAPDQLIATAVRQAVMRWRFPPPTADVGPGPYRMEGKLTFYFEMDGGRPVVRNPDVPTASEARAIAPNQWVTDAPYVDKGTQEALKMLAAGAPMLDVRERAQYTTASRSGSRNIPLDELATRLSELDTSHGVVVDCTYLEPAPCAHGAASLKQLGVQQIATLRATPHTGTRPR
jgi:TonB family protein